MDSLAKDEARVSREAAEHWRMRNELKDARASTGYYHPYSLVVPILN